MASNCSSDEAPVEKTSYASFAEDVRRGTLREKYVLQTSDSSNRESEDYEPVTSTPIPSDKRLLDSEVLASIKARACDRVSKVPSTAKTPPISQSVARCLPNWSSAAVSSSKKVSGSTTQASNTKCQTTPRGKHLWLEKKVV